jgi:hypothetical protein
VLWGDGSSSTGTLSFNASTGVFAVTGNHKYTEEGSYSITITIHHDTAPPVTAFSSVGVSDQSVTPLGSSLSAAEGNDSGSQTLATFTDPAGAEAQGDYSADVLWGDGSSSTGTISFNATTGVFTVSGSHKYSEEGTYSITITIHHDMAPPATAMSSAVVSDQSVSAVGGFSLSAAEGNDSGIQTLATFTDPAGAEAQGDYSADVLWGDGSSSTGTLSFNASTGVFTVSGNHKYTEEGTYSITITIHHDMATSAIATSSASVSDQAVSASGAFSVTAVEGSKSSSQTLATFTDPAGPEALSDYSADVNWGDGSSSAGTLSFNTGTGVFTVSGSHNYAEKGTYTITTTIHHDTASNATAVSSATVADAALTGAAVPISAFRGQPFTATVATFTDGNPNAPLSDFTAMINWGDGTPTTTVTVSINPSGGFMVTGTHTYARKGPYTFTVTIFDVDGSTLTLNGKATVKGPGGPG